VFAAQFARGWSYCASLSEKILILLWMLTSYVVDGFADVGSMVGSQLLGGNQFTEFTVLTKR